MAKQFKMAKLVTNHKTLKKSVEYRVYSSLDTFKTVSPRTFIHGLKNLEDKTSSDEKKAINAFFVRDAVAGDFRKGIELNMFIKAYKDQAISAMQAYKVFADNNHIFQLA